ncbi:MAG: hypothetical protein HQL76_05950 [Magnetococcales bacterium]|nr:hypothetical protein [Magnetococcales bacterium]
MNNYDRQILSLGDEELENFVRDWVGRKMAVYLEVAQFTGAGDMGRDVVGFLTKLRHEGDWHNYQCKQYGRNLPTDMGIREIGKILYHAHQGHFTAPVKYYFVAPRGVNRNLETLIFNPSKFKERLLSEWDKHCAMSIVTGMKTPLDAGLKAFIEAFDFSVITRLALDDILNDPYVIPVLTKWFGADPGPPPKGEVPAEIHDSELPYVGQLIDAYGDRDGMTYAGHQEIKDHPDHGQHLIMQRERFHDAAAFQRFYRDNTDPEVLETFEKDIYHGIFEVYRASHSDKLRCVDAVMTQAAQVLPSGILAPHARVPVRQGVCHHFANDDHIRRHLRWHR